MFGFFKKRKEEKENLKRQKEQENKKEEKAVEKQKEVAVKKETAKTNKNNENSNKKTAKKENETKVTTKPTKSTKTSSAKSETKTSTKKEAKVEENVKQKSATVKGKFVYYKTAKGNFNYRLKANNNETIAVSGGIGYSSLSGCKNGIESVKKNVNAPVEDQTLKNVTTLPNPKFVIFKDKAGKFRYRLFARNGELICTPEDGYASKDGCKKGIESLIKWATNSDIVSE